MKKIWITGAAGHVGNALVYLLDGNQYEILATDMKEVDITDLNAVRCYCQKNRPDVIINCAGITDLHECQKYQDQAYLVNALGARNIAQEAQAIGAKLIQMSTDDVFGRDGTVPFNEFDKLEPRSVYGLKGCRRTICKRSDQPSYHYQKLLGLWNRTRLYQ